MLAKKYKSELIAIENPFEGIFTLEFRPEKSNIKFLPGQFLHLAVDFEYDGVGQWPESRCFSMQSVPGEETIKITYAVKGDFTSEMQKVLKIGDEVWLKLPYGDLFQKPHSKKNTVFIGGGTGITPFLSLFGHVSFEEYASPRIYLGFRSREFNIYHDELSKIENSCKMNVFYQDESGELDIARIFHENGSSVSYFISGPPLMIKRFKQYLEENGVGNSNILTDDWA